MSMRTSNEDGQVVSRYSDDGGRRNWWYSVWMFRNRIHERDCSYQIFEGLVGVGLVRAYGKLLIGVADAGLCRMVLCQPVSVTVEYTFMESYSWTKWRNPCLVKSLLHILWRRMKLTKITLSMRLRMAKLFKFRKKNITLLLEGLGIRMN